MAETPPIVFRWNGEAMVPLRPQLADKHFVIGETYRLVEEHDRSSASHRHYFAVIADAWANLPDHLLDTYPTPEVLRKKMLIRCGYADERSIVCKSRAEALRVAAFIRPLDDYAIVRTEGPVVQHFTAKSQSVRAMGGKAFQESKTKVLDAIDELLGTAPGTVAAKAGKAA